MPVPVLISTHTFGVPRGMTRFRWKRRAAEIPDVERPREIARDRVEGAHDAGVQP